MLILGIETACDDTSAAVVEDGRRILSNVIWTQKEVHARFSGVVPELAARRHSEVITLVVEEALGSAGVTFDDIDAVGVNCRHGLLRSIVVGVAAAKAVAYARGLPLVGVHHIEGHIYSNIIDNPDIDFPHVCLTVSGGHNLLVKVADHGKYELIGRTLDDASGEAFDKVAKLLGLGFPGGPAIDRLAKKGNPEAFAFPRPMLKRPNYDFSFSGLKTAVVNVVEELKAQNKKDYEADVVASFQQAAVDVLVKKTIRAAMENGMTTISVAGGVAANSLLRTTFEGLAEKHGLKIVFPALALCTDNGAQIAALAYYKLKAGFESGLGLDARANAPLGELNLVYKV